MRINRILELLNVPYLILKVFIENVKGSKKYIREKIVYGQEHKQQHIDFIMPKHTSINKKVIFFIHGGGWKQGNATIFRFVGYFFARFGYVTIIAGYRLVPDYHFPKQVDDVIKSLTVGIETAKKYHVNIEELVLVGQSAGAHLASLIAYGPFLNNEIRTQIKGVVSISGPINLEECKNKTITKLINNFILNENNKKIANPYNYINQETTIPILCIHGECDPTVELESSFSFIKQLNHHHYGLGNLVIIKKGLHANISKLFWLKYQEFQLMLNWIEQL